MNDETQTRILASIATSEDAEALEAISRAAHARAKELRLAQHAARVEEFWKRTGFWKPGQTVYCGAAGTFIGGIMQRGDRATVHSIQARKKLLWLKVGKRVFGLSPAEVYRYHLQPDRPKDPISSEHRQMAKRLADALS